MHYNKLISCINSKTWYRQGAAVKPLYIGYPLQACSHFTINHREIGLYYREYFNYFHQGFMNYYFTEEIAEKIADFYWQKEKNKPGFIKNLYQKWFEKDSTKLRDIIKGLKSINITKISDDQFFENFQKFSSIYEKLWREAIFLDAFDIMGHKLLDQILQKYKINTNEKEKQLLTIPRGSTWLQKEKSELFKLLKIKHPEQKLNSHAENWYWIENDYFTIKKLNRSYFEKRLKYYQTHSKALVEEKRIFATIKKNWQKRQNIIKLKKLPKEVVKTSDFLVTLSEWRDARKAFTQMAGNPVLIFAKELSKRFKIPLKDVEHLFWWEINKGLKTNLPKLKRIIKKRYSGFISHCTTKTQLDCYYEKQAKRIKAKIDELIAEKSGLKGQTAFPGKTKGAAKIILSQKDFWKIKKGDILVAPNTRPEYVPIMKIARAIISEEGGITCHSAIVSRELQIPCVVGVQAATETIKDGDLVEVNATGGIVKIIKSKT